MLSVNDLIRTSAVQALSLQRQDGSFPPGHNGPWNDVDTPARVTAHWLVLLTTAYRVTNNAAFQSAAIAAITARSPSESSSGTPLAQTKGGVIRSSPPSSKKTTCLARSVEERNLGFCIIGEYSGGTHSCCFLAAGWQQNPTHYTQPAVDLAAH